MSDRLKDFKEALGADVVNPDVAPRGPLGVLETFALQNWWARERHTTTSEEQQD